MDLNCLKLINFFSGDYVLSSSDLLAVKGGVKTATRMECVSTKEFKIIKENLMQHGLEAVLSKTKLFGKYNIYIAKKYRYAELAREVDPSYKIINQKMTFNDSVNYVREFSELLSYPKCCYENYIDNVTNNINIEEAIVFKKIPQQISFVYNSCLNGFSNLYLSFHLPCSFNCQESKKYCSNIFKIIKKESSDLSRVLAYNLKRPFLIFFDTSLGNMYVSWDNRQGFVFTGDKVGNKLSYQNFYCFNTDYPDYQERKKINKIKNIEKQLKIGNTIIFSKDSFDILKDDTLIFSFKNSDHLIFKFLNFV